jgi:hypothetical protein
MSKYLLKVSGSNQIVNVVDWDGIGSLIAPSGYEFEPFVTESVDFINYFEEYTEETIEKLYGELEGKFTGELTGSITINGKTFQQIINETPFGEMRITDDFNINSVSSSNSFFVSGSTISLPKYNNTSETYELFFDNIIRNDVKNYKITFNKTSNPNEKISYIISDTEIINDDGFEYIKLSINSENGYNVVATQSILNPSTPNNFFYRDEHSSQENYYVDFSLPTDLQVGNFYGDFRGEIGGEKLENVLGITPTADVSVFKFDETYWNSIDTFRGIAGPIPSEGYFMFDEDSSINGEYGQSQWRNSSPTKIRINIRPFDSSFETNKKFRDKLFDVIKNNYAGSKLSLYQKKPSSIGASAYKHFEIESAYYIEKRIIDGKTYYYEMLWGSKDFTETDDPLGFFTNYIPNLNFKGEKLFADTDRNGFFELTVKQIGPPNSYIYTEAPIQDDEFNVTLNVLVKRKEITVFTESKDYVVPEWAKKLTIYAVGGGGGGGAGSNGYGHNLGVGICLDKYWDYDTESYIQEELVLNNDGISPKYFNSPSFQEKIGHDVVIGGAGGAGGSVVIAEYEVGGFNSKYDRESLENRFTKLTELIVEVDNTISQILTFREEIKNKIANNQYVSDLDNINIMSGYVGEEAQKIKREEYVRELNKIQTELDESYGIPPNTILNVLVGSPGIGGKGRKRIDDYNINQDLFVTDESSNLISIVNANTKAKTLAFQREHLTLSQKHVGITAALDIIPEDIQTSPLSRMLSIAGSIIAGALLTKSNNIDSDKTIFSNINEATKIDVNRVNDTVQWVGADYIFNEKLDFATNYAQYLELQQFNRWFSDLTYTTFNQPNNIKALIENTDAFLLSNNPIKVTFFGMNGLTNVVFNLKYNQKDIFKYLDVFHDYMFWTTNNYRLPFKGVGNFRDLAYRPWNLSTDYNILNLVDSGKFSGIELVSTKLPVTGIINLVGSLVGLYVPIAGTLANIASHIYEMITEDDYVISVPIPIVFDSKGSIINFDDNWYNSYGKKLVPDGFEPYEPKYKIQYFYHPHRTNKDLFYNQNHFHSPDSETHHGKHGGNSEIYMGGLCIVKASGGIGGTGGYSYRAILNPEKRSYGENFGAYNNFIVPGGYGPTSFPFAKNAKSVKVSPGGAGAYGTAAPSLLSSTLSETLKNRTFKLNDSTIKLNCAPSTPIVNDNYFVGNANYSLYGKTSINIKSTTSPTFSPYVTANEGSNNGVYHIDGNLLFPFKSGLVNRRLIDFITKNTSEELIPTPPGGGGGIGITWQLLDRRTITNLNFLKAVADNMNSNGMLKLVIGPGLGKTDSFKIQSELLSNNIYLGLGGKIIHDNSNKPMYLLDEIDPNSGNRIQIEIKNGGNGAAGQYYDTDGNSIPIRKQIENKPFFERIGMDPLINYELAEDVSDRWGVGGGGGAAYYITDWNNRPSVDEYLDPSQTQSGFPEVKEGEHFYNPIQDGADGGPGIIVIIADSEV